MSALTEAFGMLCTRLGRDPSVSDLSDTCTIGAAARAMVAFAAISDASDMSAKERAISMIRDLVVELETWEPDMLEVLQATPQAALMREWLGRPRVAA